MIVIDYQDRRALGASRHEDDGVELHPVAHRKQDCFLGANMRSHETEEDHQETLSLLDYVKYDYGYMFSYSERPGTPAAKLIV